MSIEFRSERRNLEVLTANEKSIKYEIEQRWDPLTSRMAVICPHLREKWVRFYDEQNEEWLEEMIEESKENCPFCRPVIDNIIAKFPKHQMDESILKLNDIYVFPNLYPRADFEAVVTSPDIHGLNIKDLGEAKVYDFLNAAFECIKKAYRSNAQLLYPVIGCNYLPPAGASLMHFHMQISIQKVPFNYVKNLIHFSERYEATKDTNFWLDLIKINKDRKIAQKGSIYWYTPFAPSGFSEVRAVVNKSNFLNFTEDDIRNLADGVSNVLNYYYHRGFASFNFVIYSNTLKAKNNRFFAGARIVARPSPSMNCKCMDSWYMPFLLEESIVLERPEDLAREIRDWF